MKKRYGLIGYPLSHSFSKKYFEEKFQKENITGCQYDLFEIRSVAGVEEVFKIENLQGFNVTIPYKHDIMNYMDSIDHSAQKVGAVNVVKIEPTGGRTGYNSDYYGFRTSLEKWIKNFHGIKALVLGVGGAAKAVYAVLTDLSISYLKISRDPGKGDLTYEELKKEDRVFKNHRLIINTTPLGMSPQINSKPDLNYSKLNKDYFMYDLIYNPAETKFLSEGKTFGSTVKNGLEMLELQAEKSWEIWNYMESMR